jgi:hypothetical protein
MAIKGFLVPLAVGEYYVHRATAVGVKYQIGQGGGISGTEFAANTQ